MTLERKLERIWLSRRTSILSIGNRFAKRVSDFSRLSISSCPTKCSVRCSGAVGSQGIPGRNMRTSPDGLSICTWKKVRIAAST